MSNQKEIQLLLLQRLRNILPVADMELDYIKQLVKYSKIKVYPAGSQFVIKFENRDQYHYLLDGKILIKSQNSEAEELGHESISAKFPLAENYTNDVIIEVTSKSMVICFNRDLLDVLLAPSPEEQPQADEEDDPADQFYARIYQDYVSSKLELPILPNIALRVKNAINDPDSSIDDVSRILQSDAATMGSIIQLANSVLYRGVNPISDCLTAINRLGLKVTRNMVISLTLGKVFSGNRPEVRKRISDLWNHSVQVAALSSVLCKQINGKELDSDRALLAGLIHDVGTLTILAFADKHSSEFYLGNNLNRVTDKLRGPIGAMVISSWGLGADMIEVALEADSWDRESRTDIDYADIVIVAQLLLKLSQSKSNNNQELLLSPAWNKFPLSKKEGSEKEVILNARKELDILMKLLESYG